MAHATSAYDDLQRLFGALISVELESAEGRSIMILTRSERVTSQA
ncbi:hypothetical protein [Alsobacter metallidurans]|nr:hypothetical protein [Alsobacter metallidurans]